MDQLENDLEDNKFFESILNQPTNFKQVTNEKGAKRTYNRKSKMNEKAKALMEQMMNKENEKNNEIISEIVNEVIDVSPINETINEPIIEQTNKKKHENILYYLRNAEGVQETRIAKNQEEYRLEKQWRQQDEQEVKQKMKEEFDKRANEVINKLTNEEYKKRIAVKIACMKLMQEVHESPMRQYEQFSRVISDAFDAIRVQVQSRTIKERIEGAVVSLYEYRKFDDDKLKNKPQTGHAMDLCL